MRVLLTGGQGFVGRHLQAELVEAGHQAVAPSSRELDVSDPAVVAAAVHSVGPDAVVHLAAVAHPDRAAADPTATFTLAVAGTSNVVEAVRAHAPAAVVMAVSSAAVYGPSRVVPQGEDTPVQPTSIYGMSKLAMEAIALTMGRRYGLSVIIARPFNLSGPGQATDFVLPSLAERVAQAVRLGSGPVRAGNLDARRDFLHIRDVVRGLRLLLELPVDRRETLVVNVASGESIAIRDVLDRLIALAGDQGEVVEVDGLVRSADASDSCGDPSKLKALTGWQPRIPIDQVIGEVWAEAWSRSAGADATTPRRP